MATWTPTGTRIDLVMRLLGLIFLSFGVVLAVFTSRTPLVSQIIPVFYFIALLLAISGIIGLIVRIK